MADRKKKRNIEIKKIEYLENEKNIFSWNKYLWAVIWSKNEKQRTQALILCVSRVVDKISLEISVMKLQEVILFECLCFNTGIIKYFIAVFFAEDILLQFCILGN